MEGDIAGAPSEVVYVPFKVLVVLMTKPGFGVSVTRRVLENLRGEQATGDTEHSRRHTRRTSTKLPLATEESMLGSQEPRRQGRT